MGAQMLRTVTGIVAGVIVWFIAATILNLSLRVLWPAYAEVEMAMKFTFAMMIARLVVGGLSSLAAGFAAAWIANGNARAVKVLAALLVALFVPVHYFLWDKFPIWYHLTFFVSLVLFPLLGGALFKHRSIDRQAAPT